VNLHLLGATTLVFIGQNSGNLDHDKLVLRLSRMINFAASLLDKVLL